MNNDSTDRSRRNEGMRRSSGIAIWAGLSVVCITALLYAGVSGKMPTYRTTVSSNSAPRVIPKETVKLWYTDGELTQYLEGAAVKFNSESGRRERVELYLCEESDYVKALYDASILGEDFPDVYVLSNDSFEKACLSGLTTEVTGDEAKAIRSDYPKSAVDAVTYRGEIQGIPWYYDTAALMYNKTFLLDWAENRLLLETITYEDEIGSETADSEVTVIDPKETEEYLRKHLPHSIEELLKFSNEYNAPDTLDSIFKWDVNDVFYTYFFAGASMNVGSETGDDPKVMDIYNVNSVRSLKRFQLLNQFFSFDSRDVSYDQVLSDFIDGKILFTVCTTDAVRTINDKIEAGECEYAFGALPLPDIADDIIARPLSVTDALVINGYSEKTASALAFIDFLTELHADEFYEATGKTSSRISARYSDPALEAFKTSYVTSVPVTKMTQTGNFRIRMEAALMRIWDGEDPNQVLRELSYDMNRQTGGSSEEPELLDIRDETFEIGTEE